MYKNKTVVAIKCGGKILRESGDTVTLPFGSEFSILLKNLHSVRSVVTVSVDGQVATEGTRLIIDPNSTLELERFIRNGNLLAGNCFKFIERTEAVENHRGVGAEDGLIRVEAWKEHIERPLFQPVVYPTTKPIIGGLRWDRPTLREAAVRSRTGGSSRSEILAKSSSRPRMDSARTRVSESSVGHTMAFNDAGITVPGSDSNQRFQLVSGFPLESQSTVIVLRLRGEIAGKPVAAPVTVSAKTTCETCGKSSKANSQFCSVCGTCLVEYA